MAWGLGQLSEEMTREFYTSYVVTIRDVISKRAKPLAQPPLQATLVQNFAIDISEATIHLFIYGPAHTLPINIAEYDYRMGIG
ncbi:hypothetical protein R3W88_026831 [Solanum pinnatisectum]|uniref:Uncharacterized protein n=1 Tax=Solanum pinnatisectum TaxID=50273 RepID=A0AAV9LFH2_9SOLN|nr:hypothetical protein R3W88_026831 [Solanum pinnatisectum]